MWRIISRPQKSKKIWRRRPQTSNVAAWLIFAGEEEDINYASSRGEGRGKEGTQGGWGEPSLGIPTRKSQRYNVLPFLSTQKTTYFLCLETIFYCGKVGLFWQKHLKRYHMNHVSCPWILWGKNFHYHISPPPSLCFRPSSSLFYHRGWLGSLLPSSS